MCQFIPFSDFNNTFTPRREEVHLNTLSIFISIRNGSRGIKNINVSKPFSKGATKAEPKLVQLNLLMFYPPMGVSERRSSEGVHFRNFDPGTYFDPSVSRATIRLL